MNVLKNCSAEKVTLIRNIAVLNLICNRNPLHRMAYIKHFLALLTILTQALKQQLDRGSNQESLNCTYTPSHTRQNVLTRFNTEVNNYDNFNSSAY